MKRSHPVSRGIVLSVLRIFKTWRRQDCWLLGTNAIRTPNVAGAVSGLEDCTHMLKGSNIALPEPNPLQKYPDVKVIPQAQRVVASDETVVDASPPSSGFPMSWVLCI